MTLVPAAEVGYGYWRDGGAAGIWSMSSRRGRTLTWQIDEAWGSSLCRCLQDACLATLILEIAQNKPQSKRLTFSAQRARHSNCCYSELNDGVEDSSGRGKMSVYLCTRWRLLGLGHSKKRRRREAGGDVER